MKRAFWIIVIALVFTAFVAWQCNGASKRIDNGYEWGRPD